MSYLRLVRRRLIASFGLIVVAVSVSWLLTRVAPGQAGDAEWLISDAAASRAADRAQAGLDRPAGEALVAWWRAALHLDFGQSIRYQRPVLPLVVERARNSALLAMAALLTALAVGLPLGVYAAGTTRWPGALIRGLSVVTLSMPPMVLAIVLSWLAVRYGWRLGAPAADAAGWFASQVAAVQAFAVPWLALALPLAAVFERVQARALAAVAQEPCLRNALGRGVPPSRVWWRHAWRMSAAPVAGVGGTIAGALLSGALAVEVVTAWPGLGRLTFDALLARDAPLVAGCATATAVLVSGGALAADLIGAWADPRVREGGS